MSIQWTLIAAFMYFEVAVTILLLVPLISPGRWHKLFNSQFVKSIVDMTLIYVKIILGAFSLFILDAIREMVKYSSELEEQQNKGDLHLDAEMQIRMKLFRAQRNFYIVGFSILFWFILQRLMGLISRLAVAEAANEASIASQQLLDQDKKDKEFSNDELQQKMINVTNEIKEIKEEKNKLEAERDTALKMAIGVKREYDRMLEEHAKLQENKTVESKKDD